MVLFENVGAIGGTQGKGTVERDTAALPLAFVEADDEAAAVFGLFDGFDDDVGPRDGKEGGLRSEGWGVMRDA